MQRNHRRSRALALLLLFALITGLTAALSLLFEVSRIQADDTGWHNPGSDNATSAGTGGDGFEINPAYAYSDDNLTAQNNGGLGDSHLFYNFGLPVPSDSTVKGIQVQLDWYLDSDSGTSSMGAELSWDGGSSWTYSVTDNVESTTERTAYLGGSSDGWGRSWIPSEFTNSNFRVRITCNSDTAGKVFYLEYLSVIIYYSPVHHLEVIGDGTMTAGGSNVLTIRARDTFGDIALNYNGLRSLTFSGPGQAPAGQIPTVGGSDVGSPVSVTFTNGVSDNATATTLVAYRSEPTTVHVSDGVFDSYTNGSYGLSLTVNADAADRVVISPDSAAVTAGNTQSYAAQSFDQFENPISDVTSSTTFAIDAAAGGSWASNIYTSEKAGAWTVTGSYVGLSDTASLTVNVGSPHHIVISPNVSVITAGDTLTYSAEAFDQGNNTLGDVTTSTAFSIDPGAGGSWAANVYTSDKAGTWTITGTYSTLFDTATLTVNAGLLDHIVVSPDGSSITAGSTQTFTAEAFDQLNNSIGSVTSSTSFSIDTAAGGSWTANVYASQAAGTWTVTGTYSTFSDTAALTVNAGLIHHIVISPDSASVTAGNSQTYTAQSFDQYNNPIADITATTIFTIDGGAGGSWTANVYTSQNTGTWTVTGNHSGITDTASLTVNAAALHHIIISPDTAAIAAGGTQTYTAEAFDQLNNAIGDVTASTAFSIEVGAGGAWAANVYTSASAGTWTVTGTYSAVSDTAALTVNAGLLHHIVISPDSTTIISGNSQIYTAQSFDQYNNPIADITGTTVFTIDAGAGGSWTANVYTSQNTGTWTVTGTHSTFSDSAALTVNAGAPDHIVISPDTSAITAGSTQTYTAEAFDQFNNVIADISSSTVFSITPAAGGGWNGNIYTSAITGIWTVTGTYIGLTDTASLTVNAGALHHIVVSPDTSNITAGGTQSYSAEAFDQFSNSRGNVTSSTSFSIQAGAGGSWAASVYTSQTAGTWTVTGTHSTVSDTATLTVNAGTIVRIVISPDTSTITARGTQVYTAQSLDQFNNPIADVTGATVFSIDAGAGGSWAANIYTSQFADPDPWIVTGTYLTYSDTASLTVNPGLVDHIIISPDTSTIIAGGTQPYAAEAFDTDNNTLGDVTTSTVFSIDVGAGGSWTANVYTSATAGTWTITGTYNGFSDTASLTIDPGIATRLEVTGAATMTAGATNEITVTARDSYGNIDTSYSGSKSLYFSGPATAPGGQIPTIEGVGIGSSTAVAFTSGVSNAGGATLIAYRAESTTVDVSDGSIGSSGGTAYDLDLTVNAGALHHIAISPDSAAIIAGNPQTYTAQSFDQFDNPIADVTASTLFSIDLGAGGSWLANVYTSASAGTWTVTGTHSAVSDTASLVVSAGPLHHIVISPNSAAVTAGNAQPYTAQSFDQFNNPIADVTGTTSFAIDAAAGGSWIANVYISAESGTWTVTGNHGGYTDTASLTVSAGALHHIVISPDSATVNAGDSQTYTAEAFDQFDNSLGDVTTSTGFTIEASAGGSWIANVYTSAKSGTWSVTGTYSTVSDTATLTVNTGTLDHIAISPDASTITAGSAQSYTAQSFDQFDNPLGDVTPGTSFSIDTAAGGSWTDSIYTSQNTGTWTVNGTYGTLSDNATLIVSAGALDYIVISPDTSTITAGNTQAYAAEAFDQFGNAIGDVTPSTAFSIIVAAGGSWAANVYTSQTAGTWTVTGTYSTVSDTATLTVNAGALHHIVISPDTSTITAGNTQAYVAEAFDQFSNTLGDATSSTSFSIDGAAGGFWTANVYTSRIAGTWTVTGTYSTSFSDTATLTVNPGAIDHYTVASDDYAQETTISFTVTVAAYDAYANPVPANGTPVTMSSSPSYLRFDGNGNGLYGEAGDDTGLLLGGILNIQAKANSTTDSLIITASDGVRTGMSEPYTIEDFRCFIATAAYGTPMVDDIQVLRDFRDQYLMKTPAGRWFVSTYYRYSPPPARFIARHDTLRATVRGALTPIIWLTTLFMKTTLIQKTAWLVSILALVGATVLWLRRSRQSTTL